MQQAQPQQQVLDAQQQHHHQQQQLHMLAAQQNIRLESTAEIRWRSEHERGGDPGDQRTSNGGAGVGTSDDDDGHDLWI